MTVESYYVIAIATLTDWLKILAPVFQPMRIKTKTKTNRTTYAWLFPRFERVAGDCYELWLVHRTVCSCCDWSEVTALVLVFRQSFENRSNTSSGWSGSILLSRDECSFQLTVESNYEIVIAALSDWLTNPAPAIQPMRSKTYTNHILYTAIFPALGASYR